jgi:hypothetical protein
MKMNRRFASGIMSLAVLILFAGGPCYGAKAGESEKALSKKVKMEWDAKVKGDYSTVYDLSYAHFKKTTKKDAFVGRARPAVMKYTIKEVRITEPGRKAVAKVEYETMQQAMRFTVPIEEEWLMENGKWALKLLSGEESFMMLFGPRK